ncbi:kin of IRRE-like protein 1 isoform X1 [Branchiostoma lanceolatum]|uniref:kin of IRRE-like protein 1 isoform X1 n=1 Tax=Branchiostoma lanceolatum TaxID=7740 RepID=UPI0034562A7C
MPVATDLVVSAVFWVLALSVVLKVDGASYRERPKSSDVLKGDTVTLHCTIDGLPPSEMVQWYGPPDMRHISSGNVIAKRFKGRYRILGDTSRGEHNLQILRAANSDEGDYRCSTLSLDETADATLTVVVPLSGPPDIIGDTAPRKAGQGLMLTCTSVGGRPPPRLTWYNGTRPYKLPDDAFKEGINKGEVMLNLVIPYLTKWDNGANLSCKANQGFPSLVKARTAVKVLNVRYPPTVTVTPKTSRVMEGESLNVTCHVDSNPPADVDWRKVGHALPFRVDNRGQVLHLDRVSSSDAGIYQCIAENGIPPDGYGTFKLEVLFTPRIRQTFDTKVSVLYGQDGFSLECVAEGNPRPQVRWRRQNTELYMGNPLVLSPVNYDVEGKYACVATSPGFASVDKETFIDVVGRPEVRDSSLSTLTIVEGGDATLICEVASDPVPDGITWFWRDSNGKETIYTAGITEHVAVREERTIKGVKSLLTVSTAALDQAGNYMCRASNMFGSDQKDFRLEVQDSHLTLIIVIAVTTVISLLAVIVGVCIVKKKGWICDDRDSETSSVSVSRPVPPVPGPDMVDREERDGKPEGLYEYDVNNGTLKPRPPPRLDKDPYSIGLSYPRLVNVLPSYATVERDQPKSPDPDLQPRPSGDGECAPSITELPPRHSGLFECKAVDNPSQRPPGYNEIHAF